jgi:hypothetical protein
MTEGFYPSVPTAVRPLWRRRLRGTHAAKLGSCHTPRVVERRLAPRVTSEVCIMNRHGLVLAADSATTASAWVNGKREERYFKGANKIFQISNQHPVALMIYDSADVLRVPWEIVVKTFRAELGDKPFNTLNGYAEEFFAFLEKDKRLFPEAVEHNVFLTSARGAALEVVAGLERQEGWSNEDMAAAIDQAIVDAYAVLGAVPLAEGMDEDAIAKAKATLFEPLKADLVEQLGAYGIPEPAQIDTLTDLGLETILKYPTANLSTTGLVSRAMAITTSFPRCSNSPRLAWC